MTKHGRRRSSNPKTPYKDRRGEYGPTKLWACDLCPTDDQHFKYKHSNDPRNKRSANAYIHLAHPEVPEDEVDDHIYVWGERRYNGRGRSIDVSLAEMTQEAEGAESENEDEDGDEEDEEVTVEERTTQSENAESPRVEPQVTQNSGQVPTPPFIVPLPAVPFLSPINMNARATEPVLRNITAGPYDLAALRGHYGPQAQQLAEIALRPAVYLDQARAQLRRYQDDYIGLTARIMVLDSERLDRIGK